MRRLVPFSLIVLCLFASIGNVAAKDSIPHVQQTVVESAVGIATGPLALVRNRAETTAPGEDVAAPDNADSSGSDAVAAPDTSDATEVVADTGDADTSLDATDTADASDQVEATAAPGGAEATAVPSAQTSVSRLSATVPVPLQHALDNVKDQAKEMQDYMRATQAVQNTPGFDLPAAVKANPDLAQQAIQETLDWANKFTDPVQKQNGLGRIVKVTTLMVNKLIARYGSLANSMKGHSKLTATHMDRRQQSDNGILLEATEPNSQATVVLTDDLRLGITSGNGTVLFAGVIFFNRFGEPALLTKESDGSEYRYSEDGYSLHRIGSQFVFSDGKTQYDVQAVAGKLIYADPNGQKFTLDEKANGSLDITLPDGSEAKYAPDNTYTITAPDGSISAKGTLENPSDTDALNADQDALSPSTAETSVSTPSDSSSETVTQTNNDTSGDTPVAPDSGSDQSGQDQGADSGG